MKNKIDLRFILALIVYAVIIGVTWGISQNNISKNDLGIIKNSKSIETLEVQSVESRLQIKGLSVQMDNMIELQKEMNQTLKEIK